MDSMNSVEEKFSVLRNQRSCILWFFLIFFGLVGTISLVACILNNRYGLGIFVLGLCGAIDWALCYGYKRMLIRNRKELEELASEECRQAKEKAEEEKYSTLMKAADNNKEVFQTIILSPTIDANRIIMLLQRNLHSQRTILAFLENVSSVYEPISVNIVTQIANAAQKNWMPHNGKTSWAPVHRDYWYTLKCCKNAFSSLLNKPTLLTQIDRSDLAIISVLADADLYWENYEATGQFVRSGSEIIDFANVRDIALKELERRKELRKYSGLEHLTDEEVTHSK